MIKALVFDLGKTIVGFDFGRGYAAMEGRCPFRAAEIPKQIGTTDLVIRFESGEIGPRDFVRELSRVLSLDMSYEEFCQVWFSIFLPGTLIDEPLLEALARRYPLVLLSNTNPIHFEMLEANYPVLRLFERRVLSHEVKAMKPSPVIYEEAIRQAGCKPGECFFADDVPAYVEGARQCGMDAVPFLNQEQLERELRARGIEW